MLEKDSLGCIGKHLEGLFCWRIILRYSMLVSILRCYCIEEALRYCHVRKDSRGLLCSEGM